MTTSRSTRRSTALTCLTALLAAIGAALAPLTVSSAEADVVRTGAVTSNAVPSVAVGKLAPSGCASSAGHAQCDLWAMPGTTQLQGTTVPIWGFSASSTPGTATAPGPVLVVAENDVVTVTVHNGLDQGVSLALPGQAADDVTEGLSVAAQTSGAAPGGTRSYTFTARRAGTFLYEAGHTPQGARQVAMGLAGALVVLAPDGQASGHAYDDEQVLVLSDLDPRLNADPTGFDMRGYRPRWRLINGRPFPATAPVSTDQGHTVLLRYVNAGVAPHPMSLLGASQLQVALDGHDLARAQRVNVQEMDAGTTADTLVTMPTGPETRLTLFETGSHLDNDGATELDPTKVAMGGMLTFLDTHAPPPLDDAVGPVTAHVGVDPATSAGTAPVTVSADLSDVRTGGSNLTAAEYVVDDPTIAAGSGVPMTPDPAYAGPTAHVTGSLPVAPIFPSTCTPDTGPVPVTLACLSAGKHVVYVRGQDAAHNWGAIGSVVLNLPKTGPLTRDGSTTPAIPNGKGPLAISTTGDDTGAEGVINGAELFLDTLGQDGSGRAMSLNRSADVVSEDLTLPAALAAGESCQSTPLVAECLTEGIHHLWVHSHNSLGLWGPPLDLPVTVDRTGPAIDAVDVTPNPSNGVVSSPGSTGYLRVSALVTDRDAASSALQGTVTRAEGFFAPTSATPTSGTGFALLPADGTWSSTSEQVYGLIPLSQVKAKPNGTYRVYVHGKDDAGNWGTLRAVELVVDKTAPTLGALTATPNPTAGAADLTLTAPVTGDTNLAAAELWTGATDPGVGKATRVTVGYVPGSPGKAVVTIPLTGYPVGTSAFHLRVLDPAGNWSNAVATDVTVSPTVGPVLFADGFDSGTFAAWSSRTGTASVLAAAGLFPSDGVNKGMSVTLPATAYVTDGTPLSEPAYHARFAFSGATMRVPSGNGTVITLFDALTASGSAYSVQVGRSGGGTGAPTRIRVVMQRTAGGALTGPWVALGTGAHRLQTDWVAGTTTALGSLRLLVDGTTVSSLTGNASSLRVDSVRLGLVAGVGGAWTGTAAFDAFTSSRTSVG